MLMRCVGMALVAAIAAGAVSAGKTQRCNTYKVDIGAAMDDLFIRDGWYSREGPYPQWGGVWKVGARWASQGATVRIPVFPKARNTITLRAQIGSGNEQKFRINVNGKPACALPYNPKLIYTFNVEPELLGDKGWAELAISTDLPAPRSSSDERDLRAAVDWITISADAPSRPYIDEILPFDANDTTTVARDQPPIRWRTRYDPNDIGDTHGIQKFADFGYDDSAFETVPTTYLPPTLRRGDAVWYRAILFIDKGLDSVRRNLVLPGDGFERDGQRIVYLNGQRIDMADPDAWEKVRSELGVGFNLIAVKLKKGPLPRITGDKLIEKPAISGEWTQDGTVLKLDRVVLDKSAKSKRLSLKLFGPSGALVAQGDGDVTQASDGMRAVDLQAKWEIKEFGEYNLAVTDEAGKRQLIPIHHLGIHFFHWGWYTGSSGWCGFQPCSNDYLDQLFSRLGDWNKPHHSITWGGAIIEPGTGFHCVDKVNYIDKFRQAIADGTLDFVGAPFPPRNICTDFGESLLRSMRRSKALYNSQFGCDPRRFMSHDATLTPLLPQIMLICGYDCYVMPDNWWGQGRSIPGSRDCYWANPDGTKVRCLDSWYHGISPLEQARRAREQGKPAVLCNEEFACLDATVFLNQSDLDQLAADLILVKPIDLDEYERVTDRFARQYTYEGDSALCYKGWTGGAESEVEYEKANRLLETRLVALENLAAFARWLGMDVPQKPIDDWWNTSLRYHECHLHWTNGIPEATQKMSEGVVWADSEMARLGGEIAKRVVRPADGVLIINPLGFQRGGLARLDGAMAAESVVYNGKVAPVQVDPDDPAKRLVALDGLPSCGYRFYQISDKPVVSKLAASVNANTATLENELIRIVIEGDGRIASITDKRTRKKLLSNGNTLYFARPHDKALKRLLSRQDDPLNLGYYQSPAVSKPCVICSGPAVAIVECDLSLPDYPKAKIKARFSLVDGERQVRVRLAMSFEERTAIWPKGGTPQPHEGTYFPGIFAAFPMKVSDKPIADMAYCLTENSLMSTNHETFMKEPFRNGTFNTLSLGGVSSNQYFVLTRGLPDFFTVKKPRPFLALSFGMGTDALPYKDSYVHEYAIYCPPPGDAHPRASAYKAAQAFYVEPVAVFCESGDGELAVEGSFLSATGDSVLIPGVQLENGELSFRVVNLESKRVVSRLRSWQSLADATVIPSGKFSNGAIELPPQAVREIRTKVR